MRGLARHEPTRRLSTPEIANETTVEAMERETTGMPEFGFPPHVYFREVDGQMVLLNLENEEYYGLDPVGTNIVNHLTDKPYEVAMADLASEYEVDPEVLRHDAAELVETLLAAGLLERKGDSGD